MSPHYQVFALGARPEVVGREGETQRERETKKERKKKESKQAKGREREIERSLGFSRGMRGLILPNYEMSGRQL